MCAFMCMYGVVVTDFIMECLSIICLVVAAPSVETPPVDQTVNEGADFVEFNCTAANTMPVPTVSWIFTNNEGHVQILKMQTSTSLTRVSDIRISSISRDKSGRYACVVENEFDKVTSSAHLTVQCKY